MLSIALLESERRTDMSSDMVDDTMTTIIDQIETFELERGPVGCADTHDLARWIQYGNEAEREIAGFEWKRRVGKAFPYHPSYDDEIFPHDSNATGQGRRQPYPAPDCSVEGQA
jgi:hypothetical protein